MNTVLWKSPKASVPLTAVHDGGNISASDEWFYADAKNATHVLCGI